jgi:hypothetical protein
VSRWGPAAETPAGPPFPSRIVPLIEVALTKFIPNGFDRGLASQSWRSVASLLAWPWVRPQAWACIRPPLNPGAQQGRVASYAATQTQGRSLQRRSHDGQRCGRAARHLQTPWPAHRQKAPIPAVPPPASFVAVRGDKSRFCACRGAATERSCVVAASPDSGRRPRTIPIGSGAGIGARARPQTSTEATFGLAG